MIPFIIIGKLILWFSRIFNLGSGSTWPGEVMLYCRPDAFVEFVAQLTRGVIFIAGTNGKTTTAKMVQEILRSDNCLSDRADIVTNDSGANLCNGLISAFIQKATLTGQIHARWAIFEVDEATLTQVLKALPSEYNGQVIVVLLNLFRDQLDRYGEVDTIARNWAKVLPKLPRKSTLILCADDPQVAYLGSMVKSKVIYFGINRPEKFLKVPEHATDSTYCHACGLRLSYKGIYFSHLGVWFCPKCPNKRPNLDITNWQSPLPGLYNEYNTLAAVSVARAIGINEAKIIQALSSFSPAFGRQEEYSINRKKVKLFLSKNPAGFNASLRTVIELKPKAMLLVLNDQIPDGRDVSWIWDVDFEMIPEEIAVFVSGQRAYDLGLRIKYAMKQLCLKEELSDAVNSALTILKTGETLYILPTYSAMLQVRKLLGGRAIL